MRSWLFLFCCNLMWALQFTCIKLVQHQVGPMFTVWVVFELELMPVWMSPRMPSDSIVPLASVVASTATWMARGCEASDSTETADAEIGLPDEA